MNQHSTPIPFAEAFEDADAFYGICKTKSDERFGALIQTSKHWRVMAMGCLGLIGILVFGLIHVGLQPKREPYPIYVNEQTGMVRFPPVNSRDGQMTRDIYDRGKLETFSNFIMLYRTVTTDGELGNIFWDHVFQYVATGSAADKVVREWLSKHDPTQRAEKETVHVKIVNGYPLTDNSYELVWAETTIPITGTEPTTITWRGTLTYVINPKWADNVNPFGVKLTDLTIEKDK